MNYRRIAIIVFVLLVLLGAIAWLSRGFFISNHITYLLNQRQFPEALQLLDKLEESNGQDEHVQFLKTKALVLTGDFQSALDIAADEATQDFPPELYYWRSLAYYQSGNTTASRVSADKFVKSGNDLPNGAVRIAKALAGRSVLLEPVDRDTFPFKMLFPVEQAVYAGLAATQQLEVGRTDVAAKSFNDAFILGNKNPYLLFRAARVSALLGDTHAACLYFDCSSTGSIAPLFQELYTQYKSDNDVSLTLLGEDRAPGSRKIDIARAVAWSAIMYLKEDVAARESQVKSVMKTVVDEYPYDPVLLARKASMLEITKQYPEAYAQYESLQKKFPSYITLIRMSTIEGVSEQELSRRAEQFIENLAPVASLAQDDITISNGARKSEYATFQKTGTVLGKFEVQSRGRYMFTIVAKGDRAAGKWPLVSVHLDEELAGYAYICRESWDCFTVTVPLEPGVHTVELNYDNDMVEKSAANRSFYLRSIYVTGAGVADVR